MPWMRTLSSVRRGWWFLFTLVVLDLVVTTIWVWSQADGFPIGAYLFTLLLAAFVLLLGAWRVRAALWVMLVVTGIGALAIAFPPYTLSRVLLSAGRAALAVLVWWKVRRTCGRMESTAA